MNNFEFDSFIDSPSSDTSSCSTQNSTGDCEGKRDFQSLKRRLKLQTLNSSKPTFFLSKDDCSASKVSSSNPKKKFQDVYKTLETIGQGACGVVKKVLHIEEDKIYVAKIVRASNQEHLEQIKRENKILTKLNHKNIVKAKEFFCDEALGNAQLILEYVPGKSIQDLIMDEGKLEEHNVRKIVEQVVSALKHVHEKGVCHRDITGSNILVNENYEVKLIDFSVSKIIKQDLFSPLEKKSSLLKGKSSFQLDEFNHNNFMLTNTGTDHYKAPEVVSGVPYNHSVDMWSLGVVTFYALTGYKPFDSKSLDKLYNKISKAEYKWIPMYCRDLSHEAVLFVKACLVQHPFIRLSAKEAMFHPWVKEIQLDLEDRTRNEVKSNFKHESPPVRRQAKLDVIKTTKNFVLSFTALD